MNKTIWIYWAQGWEDAPHLCKKCAESWRHYNDSWEVVLLDDKTLEHFIPNIPKLKINKTAYSDIVRLYLLKHHGGVWVDSTTFCNKPLDDWLPNGTFLFEKPAPGRMISSWFISSDTNSKIINLWYDIVNVYWSKRTKPHNYFWVHILFGYLL